MTNLILPTRYTVNTLVADLESFNSYYEKYNLKWYLSLMDIWGYDYNSEQCQYSVQIFLREILTVIK